MTSSELPPAEGVAQPDLTGDADTPPDLDVPDGASRTDGDAVSLEGDAEDERFGEEHAADEADGARGHQADGLTQGEVNDLFADIAREEEEHEQAGGVRDIQRPDGTREQSFSTDDGAEVTLFSGGPKMTDEEFNAGLRDRFGRTDEEQAGFYEDYLATQAQHEAARAEDARARAEEPGSDGQLEALRALQNAEDAHLANVNRLVLDDHTPIVRDYVTEKYVNGVLVTPTEATADEDDEPGDEIAADDEARASAEAETSEGTSGAAQALGRVAAEGGRGQVADPGDQPDSGEASPDRSVAAPVLERPHVGERFSEGDRSSARTAGEHARLQQLERLPHNGFTGSEIAQVREQIAALGYPVDNFKVFNHKQNERGTEDTIASWLGHGHGEFTVYDLYHGQIPEKRLGTLGHETAHANSPLKPENTAVFGGEAGQAEAARYVDAVARQSLETNIHLNGYHKYLINDYKTNVGGLWNAFESGEIDSDQFNAAHAEASRKFREETWAIMNEMALTNRNGLADVQARQHQAMDKVRSDDRQPKVDLITTPGANGETPEASRGIDTWLVKLLDGVSNQQELEQHVVNLKQRFYGEANNQKAVQRGQGHYAAAA